MELEPIYDTRKSFYGKAWIEAQKTPVEGVLRLFSYGTHVATIIDNADTMTRTYQYLGKWSQTTTRHQKEFFKQYGLSDKRIKELFKKGELVEDL